MTPIATDDIAWDDIQGGVLRGYGFDHARHLVLRLPGPGDGGDGGDGDGTGGRQWLAELIPTVMPATPWTDKPDSAVNVAFTPAGLAALGVGDAELATFPADFREGMAARAVSHVGDGAHEHPDGWQPGGPHQDGAHVLVMVQAPSADACLAATSAVVDAATARGLTVLHTETLANLAGPGGWQAHERIEHFGFADGVSQPAVEGAVPPTTIDGNGTLHADGTWHPVRPGEFVIGYPDEEEDSPPLPGPQPLVHNGTFLVWRKLAQDVAAYRRLVQQRCGPFDDGPGGLGARLVGRWPDGRPYHDAVDRDAPLPAGEGDALPGVCPAGSHIRRANPRHSMPAVPGLVSRHRLLRRGMPYGPPLPADATADDGQPRGLLFMAYCASIARQFEFVQREWLNDGNALGLGDTVDPVAGHGGAGRRFAVPGREPCVLGDLPPLVRPVAGAYLFAPGLSGLRWLAERGGGGDRT